MLWGKPLMEEGGSRSIRQPPLPLPPRTARKLELKLSFVWFASWAFEWFHFPISVAKEWLVPQTKIAYMHRTFREGVWRKQSVLGEGLMLARRCQYCSLPRSWQPLSFVFLFLSLLSLFVQLCFRTPRKGKLDYGHFCPFISFSRRVLGLLSLFSRSRGCLLSFFTRRGVWPLKF